MASKQPERVAFRRRWKLLKRAWLLFTIVFFAILIVCAVYLSPVVGLCLGVLFILGGGVTLALLQGNMIHENEEWVQQYGEPIQVPISNIEERREGRPQASHKVYYVILNWTGPNNHTYKFEQKLTTSPTMYQQYTPGTFLTVYIDPDDPSFYFVKL